MKNAIKYLGIIALVAIIGFSMIACGGDDDKDGGVTIPAELRGTWNEEGGSGYHTFTADSMSYDASGSVKTYSPPLSVKNKNNTGFNSSDYPSGYGITFKTEVSSGMEYNFFFNADKSKFFEDRTDSVFVKQ
jgi:hypothetical protein